MTTTATKQHDREHALAVRIASFLADEAKRNADERARAMLERKRLVADDRNQAAYGEAYDEEWEAAQERLMDLVRELAV